MSGQLRLRVNTPQERCFVLGKTPPYPCGSTLKSKSMLPWISVSGFNETSTSSATPHTGLFQPRLLATMLLTPSAPTKNELRNVPSVVTQVTPDASSLTSFTCAPSFNSAPASLAFLVRYSSSELLIVMKTSGSDL